MKHLFLAFISFFLLSNIYAQEPDGYYDDAQGLTGSELKTALFHIISSHTAISYDDIWNAFQSTDKKSDGTVWDIYSNCTYHFGTDQCGSYGGECDCYNREHSFPKSWFNDASPMYTDLFHIYPSDGYVNGRRSNYPYGEVSNPTYTSSNGCKLGPNTYGSYTGTVFEPADEYKGDLARSYFYMVTCYEDKVAGWEANASGADAMLNGTTYPCFEDWALQMLLEWNNEDPVSQKEIDRNNAIYNIQGNRNPFIDHPEYVCMIWVDTCNVTSTYTIENNMKLSNFYNPETHHIIFYVNSSQTPLQNINISVYNTMGDEIYNNNFDNTSEYHTSGEIPINNNVSSQLLIVKYLLNDKTVITKKIMVY